MKKIDIFLAIIIGLFTIAVIFSAKPAIFTYAFDVQLLDRYFNSQDIPREVFKRVFLSDEDIYISSGYLYARGNDPTSYDFQHPPLIKYLYGLSILYFNNPYYVQIAFAVLLSIAVYTISRKLHMSPFQASMAALLLIVDPIFIEVSTQALLDLGQSFFGFLYVYTSLFKKKSVLLRGALLGLFMASKFWAAALFFVIVISIFQYYKKKFDIKNFIKHILVASVIFSYVYIISIMQRPLEFNIVFFQLKTLKYWFHHSVSSVILASLILFITGFYKTWWNPIKIIRADAWSWLYPVGLSAQVIYIALALKKKMIDEKLLLMAIPILYLLYLGFQAPYSRYFILILPYFYISLVYILSKIMLPISKDTAANSRR